MINFTQMRLIAIVAVFAEFKTCQQREGPPQRPGSTSSAASAPGGVWDGGGYSQRRGSLQLWQFLVALLDDPGNASCIAWTGRGMEFKLVEPEEVLPTPFLLVLN